MLKRPPSNQVQQCRLLGQDFPELRELCLRRGFRFEDPYFKRDDLICEWKRPGEIARFPRLFGDEDSKSDVVQGELANCWMSAAIGALAMHPYLVKTVVPLDQNFTDRYVGMFHIRFWQFGKWLDVVVDDRLPTVQGGLVCTKSKTQNVFWPALIEKAYCKVLGNSYSAGKEARNVSEALEDFTGGIVEQINLRRPPKDLTKTFINSVEKQSLVCCSIDNISGTSQTVTSLGLVRGHTYIVKGVETVNLPIHGDIVLVRLRNPWGRFEWKGPWSDNSPEWKSVPQSTRVKLGHICKDDGEFWMSSTDFFTNFEWVEMCHLNPYAFIGASESTFSSDSPGSRLDDSSWELNTIRDTWVNGVSAGGIRNLHKNPQWRFTLTRANASNVDGWCWVLIALTQKTMRNVEQYNEIGYKIYLLNDEKYELIPVDGAFISQKCLAEAPAKRTREVAQRFNLKPGTYCLIPFTVEPNKEGEFLVRIFSEKKITLNQVGNTVLLNRPTPHLKGSVVAPMNVSTQNEHFESDNILKDYFDKISKGTKEVGRQGLKDMLEFAVNNDISAIGPKRSAWQLLNISSLMNSKALEAAKGPTNAFHTISSDGFSNNLYRNMVTLFDVNHSGKIDFAEFQLLWNEIQKWKSIYETCSKKTGGFLISSDLKKALNSAGFVLNNRILSDMIHQYSSEDGKIPFNDFLCCGFKIKIMSDIFKSKDRHGLNKAEFTIEEFWEKTVYT